MINAQLIVAICCAFILIVALVIRLRHIKFFLILTVFLRQLKVLFIALIPGRLCQLFCLGLQQFVEGFLYAASHMFLAFTLDYVNILPTKSQQSGK